jgi:hypothetical protein
MAAAVGLTFLTAMLLVYGFRPKSEFIHRKSKIARIGSERTKRNARRIIRGLVITYATFLLLMVDKPILEDCLWSARQGRPYLSEINGKVLDNDFIFGLYFVHQSLIIKDDQRSDGYTALFCPRLARVGRTYHFVIAPKSANRQRPSQVPFVLSRRSGAGDCPPLMTLPANRSFL